MHLGVGKRSAERSRAERIQLHPGIKQLTNLRRAYSGIFGPQIALNKQKQKHKSLRLKIVSAALNVRI